MSRVQELKEELQKTKLKLEEVQSKAFMLDMKDTWNNNDFKIYDKYSDEIKECKEIIKEIEHQLMFEVTEDD